MVIQDIHKQTYIDRNLSNYSVCLVVGLLWSIVLAFAWIFEEPSKLNTLLVNLLVYVVAVLIINYAYNAKIILSRSKWLIAFLIKLSVSHIIISLFWYLPLAPVDMLRSSFQNPLTTDSNFYDYIANQIASNGFFANLHLLSSTWLSFGVIGYVAAVYSFFGVSIYYVSMINTLFTLLAAISLAGVMNLFETKPFKRWDVIRWVMLLPYCSYYDSIPSKEPLSNAFYYISLYLVVKIWTSEKKINTALALLFMSISFVILVRPNLGVLLIPICFAFISRKVKTAKLLIFGFLTVGILFVIVYFTTDFNSFITDMFYFQRRLDVVQLSSETIAESGSGLKNVMIDKLAPTSYVDTILLFPVRMIVWNYLPFPMLIPNFWDILNSINILKADWNLYYRMPEVVLRQLSTWLLILFTPYVLSVLLSKHSRNIPAARFLSINFFFMLAILSNAMFVMGGRYRVSIEPLFIALGLWAFYNLKIKRSVLLICYTLFVSAVIVYSFYSLTQ